MPSRYSLKHVSIKNFERISRAEFDVRDITILGGKNRQGKSSAIDAIIAALAGKRSMSDVPLKQGASEGYTRLTIETPTGPMVVERSLVEGGTELKIKCADGRDPRRPQDYLDSLISSIAADPQAIIEMDGKQQAALIKKLLKIDTDDLDDEYKILYSKRTDINRRLRDLDARNQDVRIPEGTPDEVIDVSSLSAALSEIKDIRNALAEGRRSLVEAQDLLAQAEEMHVEARDRVSDIVVELSDFVSSFEIRAGELTDQIKASTELNRGVAAKQRQVQDRAEANRLFDERAKIERRMGAIQEEKKALLVSAKWPIEGLSFSEEDGILLYNGLPLTQASDAEKIQVAVAIGFAEEPPLKFAHVKQGSLLDDDMLALFCQAVVDAGGQAIIERVGTDVGECVLFEDGVGREVKSHD